ncbi:MAG TPA: hypothetical protein VNO70_15180 [Blastocatellia bacterium]|nr:hypothetical protein [Blastocatellia bacterium]
MRLKILTLVVILASANFSFAAFAPNGPGLTALARRAVSADAVESADAIAALRARGPAGLQAFLAAHDGGLKAGPASPQWQQLTAALDTLCAQRDCYASRLYWHTDLEAAKAEARASGKPILSLHLLGRLDEDLSCANSRLFRITLYANEQVSQFLRERYVLHWKSVRPVPKVTIDFGDGRKLERTLTGNSIHYILDAEGRPLDALPGLYGPRAFLRALSQAEAVATACAALKDGERENYLRQYHAGRVREMEAQMAANFARVGIPLPAATPAQPDARRAPAATEAARLAMTKMIMERPLLRGLAPNRGALDPTAEEFAWQRIGNFHLYDAALDENTKLLMRNKNPEAFAQPRALQRAVSLLERFIAADTARNEYLLRLRLRRWFAEGQAGDVETLNERVYSELFLTPGSDPWLGLLPADVYTGIEREGVRK